MTAKEPLVAALDPARYGPDSTVLAIRQGPILRELITWHRADTMTTIGRVITELGLRGVGPKQTFWVPPEERGWGNASTVRVDPIRALSSE